MNNMIICFKLFLCVEIICEMREDDYENKRMILRETCIYIPLINENKIQ
jgi:hypothetical protein